MDVELRELALTLRLISFVIVDYARMTFTQFLCASHASVILSVTAIIGRRRTAGWRCINDCSLITRLESALSQVTRRALDKIALMCCYFFNRGYGHDLVIDELTYVLVDDPDFLVFGQGVTRDDVSFSRLRDRR